MDVTLYRQIIGLLMYLTNTRPDICFAVNTLSQYLVNPGHIHLVGAKHVMRYLNETLDYGLRYASDGEIRLHGFIDLDWAGSVEYRKSTSGFCFSVGSCMISWFNRKQSSIELGMSRVEHIASCSSCSEAVWIRNMLTRLFDVEIDVDYILYNN